MEYFGFLDHVKNWNWRNLRNLIVGDRVYDGRDPDPDRVCVYHGHFDCSVLDFLSVTSNVTSVTSEIFYCFCDAYCDHAIANDLEIEIVPFFISAKMALLLLIGYAVSKINSSSKK